MVTQWIGQLALQGLRQGNRFKFGLKSRVWKGDGYHIAYLESEFSTSPPLVFLHGLGASKDQWGPDIYRLARRYRCLFLDMPGEGESSFHSDLDYSPARQVERLHQFLRAQGLTQVILVGASIGGCVAALYAASHPERVSKLIAMAPAGVPSPILSQAMQNFLDLGTHPFGYRDLGEMRRFWNLVFHQAPQVPGFLAKALAEKGRQRYGQIDKIVQDYLAAGLYPLEDALACIGADTLVIWGHQDQVFHVSGVDEIRVRMPQARVRVIADAGHVLYLDKGRETLAELQHFVG